MQVSSLSEQLPVEFSGGVVKSVPASYIEFTERLVLPQFKDLPHDQVRYIEDAMLVRSIVTKLLQIVYTFL